MWTVLSNYSDDGTSEIELDLFSDLENANEFYILLSKADESVIIDENYPKALAAYKELLTDDVIKSSLLKNRISHIEMIMKRPGDSDAIKHFETIIKENKKSIDSLSTAVNKLKGSNKISDSLSQKVLELTAEIARKNSELNRKQLVRVITFKNENERLIHYLGEVVNEKANGGGVGIWSTGSIYRGDWKDNKRHGKGTFEWADGMKYVGDYLDDKRTGEGKYYWPSGERYEGEWKNDKREGYGTLFDQDGNIRFEGAWKDDKPNR